MEKTALDIHETNGSVVNGTIDREAHSKFWIAAYTRPKSEKKAAAEIAKLQIETYVPTQIVIRQWSDRKKKIENAVIPMIIFANVSAEDVLEVKKNSLIIKVLTLPGVKEPAHIPNTQIERLKFMLGQSDIPVSIVKHDYIKGDKVKVIRGNLMGLEGEVFDSKNDKVDLIVSLGLIGDAKLQIDKSNLEKI